MRWAKVMRWECRGIHPVRTYLGKAIGVIPNEQFHAQLFIVFRQIIVGDIGVQGADGAVDEFYGDLIFSR